MRFSLVISACMIAASIFSQQFVNGSFEKNFVGQADLINPDNQTFNSKVEGVNAFGTHGNADIIMSANYGSLGAPDKLYYLGITGGGTDILSLALTSSLLAGRTYSISYFERSSAGYNSLPLQIGVALTPTTAGQSIYTSPDIPPQAWAQRSFTFTAPFDASYVTVQMSAGSIGNWANIDGFVIGEAGCPSFLNILTSSAEVCSNESVSLSVSGCNTCTWTSPV